MPFVDPASLAALPDARALDHGLAMVRLTSIPLSQLRAIAPELSWSGAEALTSIEYGELAALTLSVAPRLEDAAAGVENLSTD